MNNNKIYIGDVENVVSRFNVPAFMQCDVNDIHPGRVGTCMYNNRYHAPDMEDIVRSCRGFTETIDYNYTTGKPNHDDFTECVHMKVEGKCSLYVKPMMVFKVMNIRQFNKFIEDHGHTLWDEDQL